MGVFDALRFYNDFRKNTLNLYNIEQLIYKSTGYEKKVYKIRCFSYSQGSVWMNPADQTKEHIHKTDCVEKNLR